MKAILYLIRKEFLQIFRNKGMLPIIFIIPIVQLLVLSYAADFEIKNLKFGWVDHDQSQTSQRFLSKLQASGYFILTSTSMDAERAKSELHEDEVDMVFEIPPNFERDLIKTNSGQIQLLVNAVDGTKAGLGSYYATSILRDFSNELRNEIRPRISFQPIQLKSIDTPHSYWFNPELNYKNFMVPGILVLLVTMIGAFLSAMNIVREREIGTIEQLNVTPLKKYQFIIGKLFPLWILGLVEFSIGLLAAWIVFGIVSAGSLGLLYAFAAMYLIMILGMGMFISTFTDTQQQAMFISWFFLVVFLLMSGLFTAIENMPVWAQKLTLINPIRYFIEVIRLVMLKGATFWDIGSHFLIIGLYAVIINGLAVWNYRKVA